MSASPLAPSLVNLSLACLNGKNAPVVAHAVDHGLATLGGAGSLKLKTHVGIVHHTQQEQLVSDVITEEGAYESAVARAGHIRRYLDQKTHRTFWRRDRLIGIGRVRRE